MAKTIERRLEDLEEKVKQLQSFIGIAKDVKVGLIRFRGHFPKEGYDVHDVHNTGQAGAPAL
jgi:hypothetical protein